MRAVEARRLVLAAAAVGYLASCRGDPYLEAFTPEAVATDVSFHPPEQVTAGNESNFAPDLSPNGEFVFYTSDRTGNKDLWVKRTVGGFGKQLTTHPADDFAPVLSPDGKHLAFISRRDDAAGDVEIGDLGFAFSHMFSGGEVDVSDVSSPLTEDTNPSWFPSSDKLVFAARQPGEKLPALMTVELEDLKPTPLGDLSGDQPSVSPDGKSVVFVKEGALYIHHLDTNSTEQITEGGRLQDGQPRYTEDGRSLLFIRYADDTNHDGKLNGDDRPTVWRVDLEAQKKAGVRENYQIVPLTSASFAAYSPQIHNPYLYVALQTNEGLNIFRLPAFGQSKPAADLAGVKAQFEARQDYHEKTYILRLAQAAFTLEKKEQEAAECALMELNWVVRNGQRREAEWVQAKMVANVKSSPEIIALGNVAMISLDLEALAYPAYQGALDDEKKATLVALLARLEKVVKAAGDKDPRVGGQGLLLRAKILAAQHKFFEANQTLAQLLKSYGSDRGLAAEAALYGGVIAPATSDVDAAIQALRQVASDYPENRDTALRAAQAAVGLLEARPDRLEALVKLRTDAKGVPLVPALAHMRISELFAADGKDSVAANELRQIVDLYPESPEIMLKAAARLTVIEEKAERFAAAEAMLDKLNKALENGTQEHKKKAKELLIAFLLNRGEGLLKQKEPGMALKEYAKVLALDPMNVPAHRGRIDASYMRHELAEVEAEYKDKADENSESAEWTYFYGYAQTYEIDEAESTSGRLSAVEHAISTVEEARQLNGQILYVHQTLGWLYMQKNFFTHQYQRSGFMGSLSRRVGLVTDFFGGADPDWRELAIDSYQNAYFLSRAGSLERAALAQDLGVAYYSLSNFQKSLSYYLQRIKLLPVIPMRDPRAEAIVYERAGRSAFQTDELELAESLQRQALTAWENVNNEQRIAYSLDALALTLRERGKFSEASELYERLLVIQERLDQEVNKVGTLSNLGYCAFMSNQFSTALEFFARSERTLIAVENGDAEDTSKKKSDAIKVDLGGGGSSAKGFDLFSRRMLLLTFRAQIYEKLDRLDLALATYEEKLALLKKADGDPRARAEEVAILENNLGDLRLRAGMHGPAKQAFLDAETDAKELRASDQKERSPAELTNRLNRARVELRLASLGLLAANDLDSGIADLDATAGQIRPAYQSGVRAQGKPLAQVLDLSSALKATKPGVDEAQIRAGIEESLSIMQAITAPPEAMTGPLLNYNSLAPRGGKDDKGSKDAKDPKDPKDANVEALLTGFKKQAEATPSLEWKVLAANADPSRAFEALDRYIAAGGTLRTPADVHLARHLYEAMLRSVWSKGDSGQIGTLMRRYSLLHLMELAQRGGMDKARISKWLALRDSAKVQATLGDQEAALLLHKAMDQTVYALLINKKGSALASVKVPGAKPLAAEGYAALFDDRGIAALLPAAGGHLYLVPDGDLYDVSWEQVKSGGRALGESWSLSFLPSVDVLPDLVAGRRLAKATVAYLGPQAVPPSVAAGNSAREVVAVALDAEKAMLTKLSDYDLVHSDLPLFLNDVEPGTSSVMGGGTAPLAYKNDVNLRSLATATLPGTTALILSNVQHNNTDLQASGEGTDGWAFLSLAAFAAGVPTVFVAQDSKADWSAFYHSLELSSVSEAAVQAHVNGRMLGYPGIPAAEEEAFAKAHVDKALDEAEDAKADQDFDAAGHAYKRALYYAQRIKKKGSEDTILKGIVQALFQKGDYAGALKYQLRLAANAKPKPPEPGAKADDDADPVDYAKAEVDAAVLAVKASQFEQAAALLDDAEKIFTTEGMDDQLAKIWQYRAINFENQNKYEETIAGYKKAQELLAKRKPEDAAGQLLKIGNVYSRDLSDNVKALEYYAQAAEAFQKMGKPDLYVPVLIDKANVQMATGDLEAAITSLETEVLPKINLEKQRVLWVRASQSLANGYYRAGLFQQAKDLNERTLVEVKKVEPKLSRVGLQLDAISLKGMVEAKLGHYKEAFADFHDGIVLGQEFGLKSQIALLYNNYGFWARDYGAVDQSLDFFNIALRIDQELKSRSAIVFDNRNLGLSMILKGDYNGAKALLKQALTDSEALHQVYNAAYCNFGLGDIAIREKSWTEAEAYFRRALAISEQGFMQDFVWRAQAGIAAASLAQKRTEEAEQAYGKAVKVIEAMRSGLQSEDSRNGFFSDVGVQETYSAYAALLLELGRQEDAWTISEHSRSRLFVDALGAQKMRLVKDSRKNEGQLKAFDHVDSITTEELAALVGPETAVLEYHVTPEKLLIWVIRGDKVQGKAVAVTAKELISRVRDFRELMENYSTTDYLGQELADLLLTPVQEQLAGVKRIAIVPYGVLHFLPFAALPFGKDAALVDSASIFYLESATVARFSFAQKPGEAKLSSDSAVAALANPELPGQSPLPFASKEVSVMGRYFPQRSVTEGAAVTKAMVLAKGAEAQVLHLATHGEFRPNAPAQSRLLLTPLANDPSGAGDLTVEDIFAMPLKAKMVTLSACDTGLGRLSSGEEVVGMDRAFFYAGAHTVVSSLWRINDVASAVIMKRFYRYLAAGEDKAEAMRHAQMVVRRYFNHPAYWSSFRVLGDYR